jgi:hypothetical protein
MKQDKRIRKKSRLKVVDERDLPFAEILAKEKYAEMPELGWQ